MKLMKVYALMLLLLIVSILACSPEEEPEPEVILQLISLRIGQERINQGQDNFNIPIDRPIVGLFSAPIDTIKTKELVRLLDNEGEEVALEFRWLDSFTTFSILPKKPLIGGIQYVFEIQEGVLGNAGEVFMGISVPFQTKLDPLRVLSVQVNGQNLPSSGFIKDTEQIVSISIRFDQSVDEDFITNQYFRILGPNGFVSDFQLERSAGDSLITLQNTLPLRDLSRYILTLSGNIIGKNGSPFVAQNRTFYTALSDEPKMEIVSDEELLTIIQRQTFKYFWDFAHPISGLSRERNSSGDLVTIGGSGFGLMAWIVGVERGFITRSEAVDQFEKTLNFLANADRFKGVWPHWLNGVTGKTIAFSQFDDGADLVETSFMIQALLTWKQYLNSNETREQLLIDLIDRLYAEVEWDWFRRSDQNVLYWHWSTNHDWRMNLQIRGYNECMITYFLAAASPDHSIPPDVYHQGWARNGGMQNGRSFYDISLPLGPDRGGPLFFSHYSFLGLDPRGLQDQYANYMEQGRAHTLINRAYCAANPNNQVGYSSSFWGLTAGDNPSGYNAHEPGNENGTIQPTAAISSIVYTPEESMEAIKTFYYGLGDRLWGEYGFYDGINITQGWVANSYLAIDQGPIIIMIENHRTGLLWDLFMANPEVQLAKERLGF